MRSLFSATAAMTDLSTTTEARFRTRRRAAQAPLVSVCIANWNCRPLLRRCLRSLRPAKQGVPLEVIVVDNASTDGAAEMVERLFPKATLIRNQENVGFARANNQAARRARGRYLFFLNNDAVVPAGAVRKLIAFAKAHPEAGLIGPRLCDAAGRPQISFRGKPTVGALLHRTCLFRWTGLFRGARRHWRARDGDFTTTRPVEVLMGAALLAPRDAFVDCGGWDEAFTFGGEDVDLCLRMGRRQAVLYHPDVAVTHYGRAGSRRHIGYVYMHTVIGGVRVLRKTGTRPAPLWLYKAALTVDAPLHWLRQVAQWAWRRARGRRRAAARSLLVARGLAAFLRRGLRELWRA
jgi:GT2 family glycosyltransferase